MLRSFRLANHRSIRQEQELSLLPIYDGGRSAVPVAAIYGANASGKSNLLDGLRFMRDAVVDSYPRWEPDEGVPRQPFRLDPKARAEPSHFVVDVELDGERHTYGFVVDDEVIREEWLYSYPEKRRRVLFERLGSDIKFGTTVPSQRGKAGVLEELTRPNALFLSVASRAWLAALLPMYEWFSRSLRLGGNASARTSESALAEFVMGSPERQELVLNLLRFADLGITDIRVDEISRDVAMLEYLRKRFGGQLDPQAAEDILLMERVRPGKRLVFIHSNTDVPFRLTDESDGTRAWLNILRLALNALEAGQTLVVDEIDTSLHPRLTARLITLFQDTVTNPHGAQLVCTTHDTTLLSPTLGEEVLSRDQVWFTEKNDHGETILYPLSDFKPRKGENTERRYLGGSYGAVPRVLPEDFAQAVRESGLVRAPDGEA